MDEDAELNRINSASNWRMLGWGSVALASVYGAVKAIGAAFAGHAAAGTAGALSTIGQVGTTAVAAAPGALSTLGGFGAGAVGTAATGITVATVGWMALGALAVGAAMYGAYKVYQAHRVKRAAQEYISAQRDMAAMVASISQQPQLSQAIEQDGVGTQWRDRITAQQRAAALAPTGNSLN